MNRSLLKKTLGYLLSLMVMLSSATSESLAQDPRDALFFDGAATTVKAPATDKKVEKEDKTTIGGKLFLQTDAISPRKVDVPNTTLSQQGLLFLYLDNRPSKKTRVFIKASLLQQFNAPVDDINSQLPAFQRDPVRLEELWLKMNFEDQYFLTLGVQPVRWGVGRIWNPTDFLNERQKDPLAIFDNRPGLPAAKLHIPNESTGTNGYVFIRPGLDNTIRNTRFAARLEQIWGVSEWSLSAETAYDQPIKLGTDVSLGIGDVDLKAEVATRTTASARLWEGELNLETGTLPTTGDAIEYPLQWSLGLEWGIKYDDQRTAFVTLEYFHNDLGYHNNAQLYPWLFLQGEYIPLYLGVSYLGINLAFPGLGESKDHTVLMSGISNLSDQTSIIRFDYQVTVLTRVNISAYSSTFLGELGEFYYPLTIPAEVANGEAVTLLPPGITTGVWLSVAF